MFQKFQHTPVFADCFPDSVPSTLKCILHNRCRISPKFENEHLLGGKETTHKVDYNLKCLQQPHLNMLISCQTPEPTGVMSTVTDLSWALRQALPTRMSVEWRSSCTTQSPYECFTHLMGGRKTRPRCGFGCVPREQGKLVWFCMISPAYNPTYDLKVILPLRDRLFHLSNCSPVPINNFPGVSLWDIIISSGI